VPHVAVLVWPGAVIVPVIVVLGRPVHAICCEHKGPVHARPHRTGSQRHRLRTPGCRAAATVRRQTAAAVGDDAAGRTGLGARAWRAGPAAAGSTTLKQRAAAAARLGRSTASAIEHAIAAVADRAAGRACDAHVTRPHPGGASTSVPVSSTTTPSVGVPVFLLPQPRPNPTTTNTTQGSAAPRMRLSWAAFLVSIVHRRMVRADAARLAPLRTSLPFDVQSGASQRPTCRALRVEAMAQSNKGRRAGRAPPHNP